jgi:hypothetical protein
MQFRSRAMRSRDAKAPKPVSGHDYFPLSHVVEELGREGWRVRQHHVRHAISVGALDAPPKRGGWRTFSQHHISQLREYLTRHARQTRGGAK